MKQIVIATNNKNKIKEIQQILNLKNVEFLTLKQVGIYYDVEETGLTLEFNAIKKAKEYYELCKIPVIAEDSGLFIDLLNGLPGVFSKRFYDGYTEEEGNQMILENLQSQSNRNAEFRATYCYYDGIDTILAEGCMKGEILESIQGDNGFAYDKIFYSYELHEPLGLCTDEEKNQFSHRRKGLTLLSQLINL